MHFEFATATRIIFGPNTVNEVPQAAASLGRRVLLVTGATLERAAPLVQQLRERSLEVLTFSIMGEPTTTDVSEGVRRAREAGCDLIIGLGGGSVLDAGKAIAALLSNGGEPLDYLEVIGRGQPITQPAAPYIAVPTTAGTGSEVTKNAVLHSPEHRVKASIRSPFMLPRLAVVDPTLTYTTPPSVTAGAGLDALTQLIEPYVSTKANPMTDALCREGMRRVARSLRRAYQNGNDAPAREDMALASLFGGIALANAALGAVHGLAGPLGGFYTAPHGMICARLLPYVMAVNVRALRTRLPDSPALQRYEEIARLLAGNPAASAEDGAAWVEKLCADLDIPPLARWGVTQEDFPVLIVAAQKASSTKGNPILLTDEELAEVLERAL